MAHWVEGHNECSWTKTYSRVLISVFIALVQFRTVDCGGEFVGGFMALKQVALSNESELYWQMAFIQDSTYAYCDEYSVMTNRLIGLGHVYGQVCTRLGCSGYRYYSSLYQSGRCIAFNVEENWSLAESTDTRFIDTNTSAPIGVTRVVLSYQHRRWVTPYQNVYTQLIVSLNISLRSDTGRINSTPRTQVQPVIKLQNNCNYRFTIPTSDPDGDKVRCRWPKTFDECGGICDKLPSARLNETTCTIEYSSPSSAGYYILALILEDFGPNSTEPYSSVALQSLIQVFESSRPCLVRPSFMYPSYHDGECLAYPSTNMNTSIAGRIVASTVKPYTSLSFEIVSPRGMQVSFPNSRIGYNQYSADLAWQPTRDQYMQTHQLCFKAVDSGGLISSQRCASFMMGSTPPTLIDVLPNSAGVVPIDPRWRLRFSERVVRPKWQAFIKFIHSATRQTVHSVDTSVSAEIALDASGSDAFDLKVKFNFTEKTVFYVVMERGAFIGLSGCNASTPAVESSNAWTFITNNTQQDTCNTNISCSCSQSSCGQKLSPPRGACLFSSCVCNTNWTGADCEIRVFVPVIDSIPANDSTEEGKYYNRNLTVLQGDKPLTWSLVEGPAGLSVNIFTGFVFWATSKPGVHRIIVQVRNNIGVNQASWTLVVRTTYKVFLNPAIPALHLVQTPVLLTGFVQFEPGSYIKQLHNSVVPVKVTINRAGVAITLVTNTSSNGSFAVKYSASSTEYGSYTAAAQHPAEISLASAQTRWDVLGMRAVPSSISVEGEVGHNLIKSFSSVAVIVNDGPSLLEDMRAQVMQNEQLVTYGMEVGLVLRSNGIISTSLQVNESFSLDMTVKIRRPLIVTFIIRLSSRNATELTVPCRLTVRQAVAQLVSNPQTVRLRQLRGSHKTLEFNITNQGNRPATLIRIQLPPDGFLSVVGIGVSNSVNQSFGLEPLSSATLTLASNVPRSQAIGTATHNVLIVCETNSAPISVVIDVSSDLRLDFYVKVVDEYTFFADTKPMVSNAIVKLSASDSNFQTTSNTSLLNGIAAFANISEGLYDLEVTAEKHNRYKQVIMVSSIENQLTVFLQRSAVRYSWEVKKVSFDDRYEIQLTADFETRVPMPVVTIDPSSIDLTPYEAGSLNTMVFNITNHGLIRTDGAQLKLPSNHPTLNFEVDSSELGSIEALRSIIVPVRVSSKTRARRATGCTTWTVGVFWNFRCGEDRQWKSSYTALFSLQSCPSQMTSPSNVVVIVHSEETSAGGASNGGVSFSSATAPAILSCDPCLATLSMCAFENFLGSLPVIGCLLDIPSAFRTALSDTASLLEKFFAVIKPILCLCSDLCPLFGKIISIVGKIAEAVLRMSDILSADNCWYETVGKCLSGLSSTFGRGKRSVNNALARNLVESMVPVFRSVDFLQEVLGGRDVLLLSNSSWHEALKPAMSPSSESGMFISGSELRTIVSGLNASEAEAGILRRALERLNNTVGNWSAGVLEPAAGANMASFKLVSEIWKDIELFNSKAVAKGFESFLHAYNYYSTEANKLKSWSDDDSAGVCAVVKIQLNQDIAMTRDAFQASLQISNQDSAEIKDLFVQLRITEVQSNKESNEKFSISLPKPTGELKLMASSRMSLASSASGSAEWLLVPYSEAAPNADTLFDVGGRLIYSVGNTSLNISLAPARITVKPDPRLNVHYFWEKTVQADDPFTPELEPSIPFCVAVAVKNEGFGSAFNMRIASAQPEIVDNEKGLLISFRIVASSLASNPRQPSLQVSMGDFAPSETKVVDWWMLASLQGNFVSYSATFVNKNPLGDEKLSRLDELKVHELIKRVRLYSAADEDKILDFLVNDLLDINNIPEVVFSSKDLSARPVYKGELQLLSKSAINSTGLAVRVRATCSAEADGWNYYQLIDSAGSLKLPHGTVLSAVRQDLVGVAIPTENAWTQRHRKVNAVFNSLHLFDFGRSSSSVEYEIIICSLNCSVTGASDQAFFDPSAVVSAPGNESIVWTLETSSVSPSKKPEVIKPDVNGSDAVRSVGGLTAICCLLHLLLSIS